MRDAAVTGAVLFSLNVTTGGLMTSEPAWIVVALVVVTAGVTLPFLALAQEMAHRSHLAGTGRILAADVAVLLSMWALVTDNVVREGHRHGATCRGAVGSARLGRPSGSGRGRRLGASSYASGHVTDGDFGSILDLIIGDHETLIPNFHRVLARSA